MDRIVEKSLLFDFYGELLTQHQKEVYGEYIQNDLSFQKVKKTVASIHTCAEEIAECDDKSIVREKIAQIAELSSNILEEY